MERTHSGRTARREDMRLMCHTGIFMEHRSKSGYWPRSCGAPVWGVALRLCLLLHSVRSLLLRKHTAICLQFECSSCSHVTDAFVLFSRCTAAFHVSRGKLWSCAHFFRRCKRLSCYLPFPTLFKVCLELIGDLIYGMQRMLSEVLFSASAINPVSAQVCRSIHFSVHCCIATVTLFTTTSWTGWHGWCDCASPLWWPASEHEFSCVDSSHSESTMWCLGGLCRS